MTADGPISLSRPVWPFSPPQRRVDRRLPSQPPLPPTVPVPACVAGSEPRRASQHARSPAPPAAQLHVRRAALPRVRVQYVARYTPLPYSVLTSTGTLSTVPGTTSTKHEYKYQYSLRRLYVQSYCTRKVPRNSARRPAGGHTF